MKIKKISIIAFFILAIAIILTTFDIIYFGNTQKPQKSDCIIVLGCKVYGSTPSKFLLSRIERGYELYKNGYGKYIIVSGGKGSGENISEAEAMKRYLMSKGVNSSQILIDDRSNSTMANIINSKNIMRKNNLRTSIIVSNKYHLKRASLMAEDEGLNASYSGVFVSSRKSHEIWGYIRELPALVKYYMVKII